jgi:hypothetical protein
MDRKEEDYQDFYITKVQGERVEIASSVIGGRFVINISKRFIKFRGTEAPPSLIVTNAILQCKVVGKEITEARLDPKIELEAHYGKIIGLNPGRQIFTVFDELMQYEIDYNQLLDTNSNPITVQNSQHAIDKPAQMYFNGDACIEVRIIKEKTPIKLHLEKFKENDKGCPLIEYTYMKDSRLVTHLIKTTYVYYKNTKTRIHPEEIAKLTGKEVSIIFTQGNYRAEVNEEPPTKSDRGLETSTLQSKSPHTANQDKAYTRTDSSRPKSQNNSLYLTESSDNKTSRVLRDNLSVNYNQNTDYSARNSPSVQIENPNNPVYAKRSFFAKLLEVNYFLRQSNPFSANPSAVILIGLLEVLFRFPDNKIKNILPPKIYNALNELGQIQYNDLINYILNSGYNRNNIKQIEDFYVYIDKYSFIYIAIGSYLFPDPKDFFKTCEDFGVCFEVISTENGALIKKIYHPILILDICPVISVYDDGNGLYLIYPTEVMEFDGFDPSTLNLVEPKKLDMKWPIVYTNLNQDYVSLVTNVYNLLTCFKDDKLKAEKLNTFRNDLILTLSEFHSIVPKDQQTNFIQGVYGLKNFDLSHLNFKDYEYRSSEITSYVSLGQTPTQKSYCICKNEVEGNYSCPQCGVLCKKCAFYGFKFNFCFNCKCQISIDMSSEEVVCAFCSSSRNTQASGVFLCRCACCFYCLYNVIEKKTTNGVCKCGYTFQYYDQEYNRNLISTNKLYS